LSPTGAELARFLFLSSSPASKNVINEMSEENRQQQASDAAHPEEKMLGQLWGIDLLLVHN
jgi:hypothetical protein